MPDRQIDYGEDATDATYRSGDAGGTTGGGNFVVAELLGDRVLFEWDQTTDEWVSRGPVNLSGNDLANVGTLSASVVNADDASVTNAPTASTDVARKTDVDAKADDPHADAAHSLEYLDDGDGVKRKVWIIANGASDPAGASNEDIILEEEA